jgi:hypothetical protein
MKFLLIAIRFAFTATSAKAGSPLRAKCEATPSQIVTVLVNSTEKLVELKKNYLDQGRGQPTCRKIEDGVTEFTFEFTTCGNCLPKAARLTVVQDVRPSYMDGAVKYDATLTYLK